MRWSGAVRGRIDLGDVHRPTARVRPGEEGGLPQLVRAETARRGRWAAGHDARGRRRHVEVDVDGLPAEAAISSASAIASAIGRVRSDASGDHGDAQVASARGVLSRVGEVGDADLDDALARQPGFDEAAHGRAIADAVAKIVMRVESDETGGRDPLPPHPRATP